MHHTELHARRLRLGLTQAEIAHALGVETGTWSRWERGTQTASAPGVLRFALNRLLDDKARLGPDHAAWKAHVASFAASGWQAPGESDA